MKRTITNLKQKPEIVVNLLAPSHTMALEASKILSSVSSFEPMETKPFEQNDNDALNKLIYFKRWASTVLQCTNSQTILHWISPTTKQSAARTFSGFHELLSIQCSSHSSDTLDKKSSDDKIVLARTKLARHITKSSYLTLRSIMGASMRAHHLLGVTGPVLDFEDDDTHLDEDHTNRILINQLEGVLKEVVLPISENPNEESLLTMLSRSSLSRPATGLYQWHPTIPLRFRPIPLATEDRKMAPPSLIFHTQSLDELEQQHEGQTSRIGYNGLGKGQIMLREPALNGLDVRFCEKTKPSSAFFEAQESLLANSTSELQSTHVLGSKTEADPRQGNSDCWVEFRAGVKDPVTFWSSKHTQTKKPRIAKIPDIPPE